MKNGFISFEQEIKELINLVVKDPLLHGLWINTLSYLENCGARKIASCEHQTNVKETMLKHAFEEFRHAFYLKKQLLRIDQNYQDYRLLYLMGGWVTHHYLDMLDMRTSRYLSSLGMTILEIKQHAYLLVTYAIELRAGELYPIYQASLKQHKSTVQVQSILIEEKEHLHEMECELSHISAATEYIKNICIIESNLFKKWLAACYSDISLRSCFQPTA